MSTTTHVAVAAVNLRVRHDGRVYRLHRRVTIADVNDPLVVAFPDLWAVTALGVLPEDKPAFALAVEQPAEPVRRPRERDARAVWEQYAVDKHGLVLEALGDLTKSALIALVDGVECGAFTVNADGTVDAEV